MKRVLWTVAFILAASVVCSAQNFYFPQVAVGAYDGGSWKTTIFLSNGRTDTASGTVAFTKSDGTSFNSTWLDDSGNPISNGNIIAFQLGPSESRRFTSVTDIPLTTGFATVTSNSLAVLGSEVFSNLDSAGNLIAEAGVSMSIPIGKQAIFIDTTNGFKTGIAIANPNTTAPLHIHFEVMNTAGQIIMSTVRDVPASQHFATFVHELFPDIPAMVGRLQFYCTNPIVSVGMRFDLSFVNFTTMPPLALLP
ncbi:MAG TPA: hypothetical protein VE422_02960 [Terriglobia bacterium]|nr:hypothetical protein [Terriglobia bacterium]